MNPAIEGSSSFPENDRGRTESLIPKEAEKAPVKVGSPFVKEEFTDLPPESVAQTRIERINQFLEQHKSSNTGEQTEEVGKQEVAPQLRSELEQARIQRTAMVLKHNGMKGQEFARKAVKWASQRRSERLLVNHLAT